MMGIVHLTLDCMLHKYTHYENTITKLKLYRKHSNKLENITFYMLVTISFINLVFSFLFYQTLLCFAPQDHRRFLTSVLLY